MTLSPPDWTFDGDSWRRRSAPRTRAIVVGSPHNPTGKVFTPEELGAVAELCVANDAIAITDEIYEHITYDGAAHVPIATLPGMAERTVTISALSKTYAVTGWRVGWAIAAPAADGGHPFDARLPHRGGRDPVAACGGGGARVARGVLRPDPPRVPGAARHDGARPTPGRVRCRSARGRLLRHGRRVVARLRRRRIGRSSPRRARRGCRRAGLLVLLRPVPRRAPAALRVPEEAGHPRGGRAAPADRRAWAELRGSARRRGCSPGRRRP